ncbi:hypothetical protein QJS10_CPB20g01764 [Acorus calamus]|uniref:Uncharacterized protein n=1 Tax=Acorus calamus TaxID=4465 RepID=A0AAV9C8B2_ACOCL|nr:hypothetical protein QJS10_CPB20g01764 [Acorus calamus]
MGQRLSVGLQPSTTSNSPIKESPSTDFPFSLEEEVPYLMDRIEKTIEYIKHLEEKLKMLKERKESINRRERVRRFSGGAGTSSTSVVVVINSPGEKFAFYNIIVVLEEEGAQVLNASFSVLGDKVLYTVHSSVPELKPDFEVGKMMERMKGLFVPELKPDFEVAKMMERMRGLFA